jgi:hypothetical protein
MHNTYKPVVGCTSCVACPAETDCMCDPALGYVQSNPGATGLAYSVCAAGYYMSQPPAPLSWDFSTLAQT